MIEDAAKAVNADSFILQLRDGYQTQVGEGGGRLSGGQKQLISFARAVLADAQILIMDEATSSVDSETEYLIKQALKTVLSNRTNFIITHRLSTIRQADRILLLSQGRIEEQGNHQELIDLGGAYQQLYQKQFRHFQEQEVRGGTHRL